MRFDAIYTKRSLQNLDSWDHQAQVIQRLQQHLTLHGVLICLESCMEGLEATNQLRTSIGLDAIQIPWHNNYLYREKVKSIAREDFPLIACEMVGSTYYFLSRVVYAYLAKQRNEPLRYDSDINQLALKLPQNIGHFSPMHCFVFKRVR